MNAGGSPELAGAYVFGYGCRASGYATEFIRASSCGSGGPPFAHEAGSVSMMFSNDKNRPAGAWGGLKVGAFGRTVAPIPELSTYALIATDLLTIGVVAKCQGVGGQHERPTSLANAKHRRYNVWRIAG